MTENLVHPPVLQYRAISRNLRLFWDALGVICAWVPLGLAGGVVRGVNGGRRALADPNATHGPGSNPKGSLGTQTTPRAGIPDQPEIERDCSTSQNGRVHNVFGHMGGRMPRLAEARRVFPDHLIYT